MTTRRQHDGPGVPMALDDNLIERLEPTESKTAPAVVAWPSHVLKVVGGVGVVALVVQTLADVLGRSLFNSPVFATLDLVQYWWMPIAVFAGIGYAEFTRQHVSVESLAESLGTRAGRWHRVMVGVVTFAFVALLALLAIQDALEAEQIRSFAATSELPIWQPKLFVPLGWACMLVVVGWRLTRDVRGVANEKADSGA